MQEEDRKYDIVVFGAAGFTGKHVVRELLLQSSGKSKRVSIAVAGRSETKLRTVANQMGCASIDVLIADARDEESLRAMAKTTKIVINTVGPFRLYGRPVVQACIREKTWYLDVCGEPEFMERIEYEMDVEARKQGCYVVSAVGFDSVPTDLGNLCVSSAFEAPAVCTSVETFIELQSGPKGIAGHFPTYESAVYGLGSSKMLSDLRRKASRRRKDVGKMTLGTPSWIPMKKAGTFDDRIGSYLIPFMGSCPSVIRRSLISLAEAGKPVFQSRVYMGVPSFWIFLQFAIFGSIFRFLSQYSWGRSLLLRFPGFFSRGIFTKEGPSIEQIEQTSFKITCLASGFSQSAIKPDQKPDKTIRLEITGPEPGYVACSIFIVAAAMTLLEEANHISVSVRPGVMTPGILLRETSYIERVQERGILFKFSNN